ncbi:MAG: polysaccharide biosynthesis protein [Dysgonamonadaceae bacterium]|jgi:FlaA1/EpsC-like NDP-sugar epimerase|nr:polysaccharide biosynthesis protein [Dysgonamonadaceae bacterium]
MTYNPIQLESLLGREPIVINPEFIHALHEDLKGKTILITGAAGSIGSEIVRQVARFNPGRLLLCDVAETPLYTLGLEMDEMFPAIPVELIICDVRNVFRMEKIFKKYSPQHVYHAAAYKHVPMMEAHPSEAALMNVFGTKNIVDLSVRYQVQVFVMISTDKAVNPVNVMGASKRIAEIYVQSLHEKLQDTSIIGTRIITTRFGNVLGSNGSVISRFEEQIRKGGPVTVTHPDIIRYFMTIPEACRLVLEAANMGKGGEIFVFDMGEPVKIVDLAQNVIRLSGYTPGRDVKIVFTGLRPGEKLYEEMMFDDEQMQSTCNRKIRMAYIRPYNHEEVSAELCSLYKYATEMEDAQVVKQMKRMVPEFVHE